MKSNPRLTPEQQAVLFDKVTEAPFSGSLLSAADDGAVTYTPDNSHGMRRTEVTCANCGGQLHAPMMSIFCRQFDFA